MFAPVKPYLADIPVLAIDLPGQGLSPALDQASIPAMGQAVAATLLRAGVSQAVVAGVSMGGYVTLAMLRDAPELVVGAVLMHTKATADSDEAAAGRLAVARQVLADGDTGALMPMAQKMISPKRATPALLGQVEAWIAQATPEGVAYAQQAMAGRADSMAVLRATGRPITIVAGTDDPFVAVSQAEAMADAAGKGTFLSVAADVAHLSPVEAPDMAGTLLAEAYGRAVAAL
jgi:pimeloyl-ACP methyl ester carboxylesterase